MSTAFVVLIPVKPLPLAKSRLVGLAPGARSALARAFALDAVAVCAAVPRVAATYVVTDDTEVRAAATECGAGVLPDDPAGLNPALVEAALAVAGRHPGAVPTALLADVPSLTASDLEAALARIDPAAGGFVADADGTGTTLYAAADFRPAFGPGSRDAHAATGAREIALPLATLRRDVDDLPGLSAAEELGVGRHTAAVLAELAAGGGRPAPAETAAETSGAPVAGPLSGP